MNVGFTVYGPLTRCRVVRACLLGIMDYMSYLPNVEKYMSCIAEEVRLIWSDELWVQVTHTYSEGTKQHLYLLHVPRLRKYLFEHVYFDWRSQNYLPSTVLSPKNQTKHPLAMGVEQAEHFEMATKVSNRRFPRSMRIQGKRRGCGSRQARRPR